MNLLLDLIFGLLFGTLTYIAQKKGININIHHVYENKIEPVDMKELTDSINKADATTDQTYADMGSFIDELTDIMGGGSSGKETR